MMKIFNSILLLVTLVVASSCDVDDDNTNFHYETLEITDAKLPEAFEYGKLYTVEFNYLRPTNCHYYEGFDFQKTDKTERTIYAIGAVLDQTDCQELTEDNIGTATFNFEVRYNDPYTFKFYSGDNEDGEKQYITIEVPVAQDSTRTSGIKQANIIKSSQYN
ncbi:hypothetical protein [Galbibacter marinus]|nr:hypothetical protein [Galbibacter marinus]